MAFLFIDIDHFKNINDTYGHSEGDLVWPNSSRATAAALTSSPATGGEEFAILLLDTTEERALSIAERIRQTVEQTPFLLSTGQTIWISVSVGLALSQGDQTLDSLILQADQALYTAKHTGRNQAQLAG